MMLDFAQNLSKRLGCNGYFHLDAIVQLSPKAVPHIFYRKYGMNSGNYELDKKMDKFVRKNKSANRKQLPWTLMYYPPVKYPENTAIPTVKTSGFFESIFRYLFK